MHGLSVHVNNEIQKQYYYRMIEKLFCNYIMVFMVLTCDIFMCLEHIRILHAINGLKA